MPRSADGGGGVGRASEKRREAEKVCAFNVGFLKGIVSAGGSLGRLSVPPTVAGQSYAQSNTIKRLQARLIKLRAIS